MNSKTSAVKGFTLIELLVVIAIVAILSVVVILSLNPAELLKQARDSNRFSDMATIKSAISLYLADVSTPDVAAVLNECRATAAQTQAQCDVYFGTVLAAAATVPANPRAVDGNGWVSVNFNNISSGSPVSQLPLDPVNNGGATGYFYAYKGQDSNLTFKLVTKLESTKYNVAGYLVEGGIDATSYEVGTDLAL